MSNASDTFSQFKKLATANRSATDAIDESVRIVEEYLQNAGVMVEHDVVGATDGLQVARLGWALHQGRYRFVSIIDTYSAFLGDDDRPIINTDTAPDKRKMMAWRSSSPVVKNDLFPFFAPLLQGLLGKFKTQTREKRKAAMAMALEVYKSIASDTDVAKE